VHEDKNLDGHQPSCPDPVPLRVVDLGRVVDQHSLAVAQVEPELQEAVSDPEHQVVAGRGRVAAPRPEQEAVGRRNLDPEVEGVGVADEAETGTRF